MVVYVYVCVCVAWAVSTFFSSFSFLFFRTPLPRFFGSLSLFFLSPSSVSVLLYYPSSPLISSPLRFHSKRGRKKERMRGYEFIRGRMNRIGSSVIGRMDG